jgi:hypothetical protein
MSDQVNTVVFSSEKATVLNAIYDVIDSLGLIADHINSERGVVLVRTPDRTQIRIMVDTVFPSKKTKVGIISPQECDWSQIIIDELSSILTNSHNIKEDTL